LWQEAARGEGFIADRGAARIGRIGAGNGSCADASDENANATAIAAAAVRRTDENPGIESLGIMSPVRAKKLSSGITESGFGANRIKGRSGGIFTPLYRGWI
jgi:hypothetical protein